LETMYWPDEIRAADFEELQKPVKLRPQEVQMAQALIENLTEDWNPEEFHDEYREALMDIVEKKAAGEEIVVAEPEEEAKVVDLMEALKASVEAAKKKPGAAKAATSKKEATGTRRKKAAAS